MQGISVQVMQVMQVVQGVPMGMADGAVQGRRFVDQTSTATAVTISAPLMTSCQ
jgi:hypothetical protein